MRTVDFWPRRPMDIDRMLRSALVGALIAGLAAAAGHAFEGYARGQADNAKSLLDIERKKRAKAKKPVDQERAELDAEMAKWSAQEADARAAPSRARGAMQALESFNVQGARVDRFLLRWDGSLATLRAEGAAQSREAALAAGRALLVFGAVASGGAVDVGWDGSTWGFFVKELPPLPPAPSPNVKAMPGAGPAKTPAKMGSDLLAPTGALATPTVPGSSYESPKMFKNGEKP